MFKLLFPILPMLSSFKYAVPDQNLSCSLIKYNEKVKKLFHCSHWTTECMKTPRNLGFLKQLQNVDMGRDMIRRCKCVTYFKVFKVALKIKKPMET